MEYSAAQFVERLEALRSPDATGPDDYRGVGMGQIFGLARECMDMSPAEIERLLESPTHAVRVGAVSVVPKTAPDLDDLDLLDDTHRHIRCTICHPNWPLGKPFTAHPIEQLECTSNNR